MDDDPGDVRLTMEALRESKLYIKFNVACDGVEAMAFLHRQGEYVDAQRPDLILLDLNMPRKDGREVLVEIKADLELKRIPVVMFTTSQADQDVLMAYNLSTNCYMTQPVDFDQFAQGVQALENFWFTVVRLPPD